MILKLCLCRRLPWKFLPESGFIDLNARTRGSFYFSFPNIQRWPGLRQIRCVFSSDVASVFCCWKRHWVQRKTERNKGKRVSKDLKRNAYASSSEAEWMSPYSCACFDRIHLTVRSLVSYARTARRLYGRSAPSICKSAQWKTITEIKNVFESALIIMFKKKKKKGTRTTHLHINTDKS